MGEGKGPKGVQKASKRRPKGFPGHARAHAGQRGARAGVRVANRGRTWGLPAEEGGGVVPDQRDFLAEEPSKKSIVASA